MYRDWAIKCCVPMHKQTILQFIEALVIMIAPICPHWSDSMYCRLKKNNDISVCQQLWPTSVPYDKLSRKQYLFFREFLKNARQASIKAKVAGGKGLVVYLASKFEEKRTLLLQFMASQCDAEGLFPDDFLKTMKDYIESNEDLKVDTKRLMMFGAFMRDEAKERGVDALAGVSPFDQQAILNENKDYIIKTLDLVDLELVYVDAMATDGSAAEKKMMETAVPGKPAFHFKSSTA
jgi:leucyl-tRNA synthetase